MEDYYKPHKLNSFPKNSQNDKFIINFQDN